MYWRRFHVKDIPTKDPQAFDKWLLNRWREKDELIEQYLETGRFPADDANNSSANGSVKPATTRGYIEVPIAAKTPLEYLQLFIPLGAVYLLSRLARQVLHLLLVTIGLRAK
jgi:lysocardiolipin and lysophospholipid acyltransferase